MLCHPRGACSPCKPGQGARGTSQLDAELKLREGGGVVRVASNTTSGEELRVEGLCLACASRLLAHAIPVPRILPGIPATAYSSPSAPTSCAPFAWEHAMQAAPGALSAVVPGNASANASQSMAAASAPHAHRHRPSPTSRPSMFGPSTIWRATPQAVEPHSAPALLSERSNSTLSRLVAEGYCSSIHSPAYTTSSTLDPGAVQALLALVAERASRTAHAQAAGTAGAAAGPPSPACTSTAAHTGFGGSLKPPGRTSQPGSFRSSYGTCHSMHALAIVALNNLHVAQLRHHQGESARGRGRLLLAHLSQCRTSAPHAAAGGHAVHAPC